VMLLLGVQGAQAKRRRSPGVKANMIAPHSIGEAAPLALAIEVARRGQRGVRRTP
jgi:hypothetical protein